jgi:hypothetical protein
VSGFLEQAGTVLERTSKRAARMPEQLALDEGISNRTAVRRNEPSASSRRRVMDQAGEALLADAALTDDQDRGIESGNLRSAVKRFLHRGTGHTQTEFSLGTMPV